MIFWEVRVDTKRLRYFCTIVEQGQISRAAQALNISQPPLSQRLKELEDELQTPLIIRGSGRWEVTDAGRVLYEHARRILDQLDGVHELVTEVGQGFSGQLNIGVSSACLSYLATTLPFVHAKYPKLRYRVSVLDSNLLEKSLVSGVLDFGMLLLPVEDESLAIRLLRPERFVAVCSRTLGLPDTNEALSLNALVEFPLILSRRWCGWGGYKMLIDHWQKQGKRPNVVLDSQNIQILIRLLEGGLPAVALLPAPEATKQVRQTLQVSPLYGELPSLQPAVIYHSSKVLSRAASMFIDKLVRHAQEADN